MKTTLPLLPLLVVRDAADASEFHVRALDAQVLARHEHGARRHVRHAELALGSAMSSVTASPKGPNNISTLEASPPRKQALLSDAESTHPELGQARRRPRVHLVIGPVGAGKSTFALRLAREQAALRLTLDQWMVQLFSPDRPGAGAIEWYVERAARCVEQIWNVAQGVTDLGHTVVLEIGLLQRRERERFCQRVRDAGLELTVHVLDAARDVRRERVNERNQAQGATFSMVVPPAIFELASDLWEPPDESECQRSEVVFLRTDGS